jgi:uncharacterized membrane protein YgcG
MKRIRRAVTAALLLTASLAAIFALSTGPAAADFQGGGGSFGGGGASGTW